MQKLMERIREEDKIYSTIKRIVAQRVDVVLWQYDHEKKRILKNAQIFKFDESNNEIFFTPKKNIFNLDLNKYLYCLYKERAMVFKGKIGFCSNYKLAIEFPKQILVEESRQDQRLDPTKGQVHLNFNFGSKNNIKLNHFPFSTILNDYSFGGLSFITNVFHISKFHVGDIMIFKLGHDKDQIKEGRVVHISKTEPTYMSNSYQQQQYKIGIEYSLT
jgi:hypothetical protein